MSVVSPPSSNTNIGNAGAGGSTTQISAIAWATSSISINNTQVNRLYPAISSGTQRPFSWFHNKKFRVIRLVYNGFPSGGGTTNMTYPFSSSTTPYPTQDLSYRYDTYDYITVQAFANYPYTFSHWAYGTSSAPTSGSLSSTNPINLGVLDFTTTDFFYFWAVFTL
jgi:hypothetical protein